MTQITRKDVEDALERITPYIQPTPLLRSRALSEVFKKNIWLKLETQQPTGAFKIRPALNGILAHLEQAKKLGVIASSSGNFAQAVAFAARELGVSAVLVMTNTASPYKMERTRMYGAEIHLSGPSFKERWDLTEKLQKKSGRLMLHPYDSVETIAGDATMGLELLDQMQKPFTTIIPSSGGGLIAGTSFILKTKRPELEIIAAQPEGNGAIAKSLIAKSPVNVGIVKPSLADALVAAQPGARAFELIQKNVRRAIDVTEDQLKHATRILFEEQKLVVEPGGAAGVAALFEAERTNSLPDFDDIVCVLTGANIDPKKLAELLLT